ncbi:dTMP kinase [Stappia sp. F7233]|uniref:Thymidylate kinase n=1 Tax=Stappia albiluteola TaxID=2758565 RepID=A0A839ACW0_9HYPH|nr:dTMP kinase [Stappia albiluteola]MBA5776762.1 dTMP kinase [Stappia albiluteola]
MAGQFITFEGGEGAGKSTQIARLKARLEAMRIPVLVTREPGGSPGAEAVRNVLLSGKARQLGADAEALLFAAARADHMDTVILPALAQGKWVLCDRFTDSTRVYQGEAGVAPAYIEELERLAIAGRKPDLTLLIDVPAQLGLARVHARSSLGSVSDPDRFEQDDIEVHKRRRRLFLDLAETEPDRLAVIDGSKGPDSVAEAIWQQVQQRLADALAETKRIVPIAGHGPAKEGQRDGEA